MTFKDLEEIKQLLKNDLHNTLKERVKAEKEIKKKSAKPREYLLFSSPFEEQNYISSIRQLKNEIEELDSTIQLIDNMIEKIDKTELC